MYLKILDIWGTYWYDEAGKGTFDATMVCSVRRGRGKI